MDKKIALLVIFVFYLVPAFIQYDFSHNNRINRLYFGLPFTQTGDEPHYYIILYSLVNDYDFFLTNNYDDLIYNNSTWLKKKLTFQDRHTRIFDSTNKNIMNFPFINATYVNLSLVPSESSNIKEISGHPMGLPIFAFIFLWPFKNTALLENLSIFLTLIFSLLGILTFYKLIKFYHDEKKAIIFTLMFAFATQYWHYSKTFWVEPYLTSFLIISWYFFAVKRVYLIPGLLLGFGFLMKYPFVLAIAPFYIYLLFDAKLKKRVNSIIFFTLPLMMCFSFLLYQNYYLTNNFLHFNQAGAVSFINPIIGTFNWFFNPTFGLLIFSPVLVFGLFGINKFFRKNKLHCVCLLFVIILYSLFWVSYSVTQNGAGGYSARYLVPLIPFICLFISFINLENKFVRYLFYFLFLISIIINILSAFAYPAFISNSIVIALKKIIIFIM